MKGLLYMTAELLTPKVLSKIVPDDILYFSSFPFSEKIRLAEDSHVRKSSADYVTPKG